MNLSVIIVTWNGRAFVAECLQSLTRDTNAFDIEIIVVDNASTDGTPEMIAQDFPNVHLVKNSDNLGFAKANNIGIALASRDYVFLVNSDVNVLPGCLEALSSYLDQHPDVGLVGPQMLDRDLHVRRSCMRFPTLWNVFCRSVAMDRFWLFSRLFGGMLMADFAHDTLREVDVLNGWFWATRREALDQVHLLDEQFFMYGEDVDWCYRFHQAGWRVIFLPEARAIHYGGASSSNAPTRFYIERQKANLQFWRKYHRGYPRIAFKFALFLSELLRILGHSGAWLIPARRQSAEYKIRRSAKCMHWLTSSAADCNLDDEIL